VNILALNPGSATLLSKLMDMPPAAGPIDGTVLAARKFDHIHGDETAAAAEQVVADCLSMGIDAIGYRVVHGGRRFDGPTRITPAVLEAIRSLANLAPLHNPVDLSVIEAASRRAPGVQGVAVFDTAFHRTLPEVAWRYALPAELGGVEPRRYGFHGIAHRYVSERLLECLEPNVGRARLVLCHLGGGGSLCAVRNGMSVDTTMGMTPLEGLVMSTRSGDLDPGLLLYLIRHAGMTAAAVEDALYHKSGLLGLSGLSDDIRDLEPAAAAGDKRAELALAIQAYRVRKYIGAYAAALGGMDAIALSGALAENSAALRARVLDGLEFLGVRLDPERNRTAGPDEPARISTEDSAVPVWVVPADEERQIAREVAGLLAEKG
jgi:acetate kinase